VIRTCKANDLHLAENIDALWLNSGKSNDLRTHAFNIGTKRKSQEINIFWIGWSPLSWHYKKWG